MIDIEFIAAISAIEKFRLPQGVEWVRVDDCPVFRVMDESGNILVDSYSCCIRAKREHRIYSMSVMLGQFPEYYDRHLQFQLSEFKKYIATQEDCVTV